MEKKIHMPMDFTPAEKSLVRDYIRRYKRSHISMNMLMIARFGSKYYSDCYINLITYLTQSLIDKNQNDNDLIQHWHLHKENKDRFFGLPKELIRAPRGVLETEIINEIQFKKNHY